MQKFLFILKPNKFKDAIGKKPDLSNHKPGFKYLMAILFFYKTSQCRRGIL